MKLHSDNESETRSLNKASYIVIERFNAHILAPYYSASTSGCQSNHVGLNENRSTNNLVRKVIVNHRWLFQVTISWKQSKILMIKGKVHRFHTDPVKKLSRYVKEEAT